MIDMLPFAEYIIEAELEPTGEINWTPGQPMYCVGHERYYSETRIGFNRLNRAVKRNPNHPAANDPVTKVGFSKAEGGAVFPSKEAAIQAIKGRRVYAVYRLKNPYQPDDVKFDKKSGFYLLTKTNPIDRKVYSQQSK